MRKRDDPHQGFLFRVVARTAGSEEPWEHTAYGHYGKPRTYMTLSAARGMKTRMEQANKRATEFNSKLTAYDFAVERSPIIDWELVAD